MENFSAPGLYLVMMLMFLVLEPSSLETVTGTKKVPFCVGVPEKVPLAKEMPPGRFVACQEFMGLSILMSSRSGVTNEEGVARREAYIIESLARPRHGAARSCEVDTCILSHARHEKKDVIFFTLLNGVRE